MRAGIISGNGLYLGCIVFRLLVMPSLKMSKSEMDNQSKISQEELDALASYQEVSPLKISKVHTKIRNRCALIVCIWMLRVFVVAQYPEYHLVSYSQDKLLSAIAVDQLLLFRITLATLGSSLYLLSFFFNRYFRTANVIAMLFVTSIIWSDIQIYVVGSLGDLTLPSLAMILIRFIPLFLLFMNYIDVRK